MKPGARIAIICPSCGDGALTVTLSEDGDCRCLVRLEARPWKRLHNEFQDCLNGVQRLATLVSPDEGEEKIIGKI